MNLRDAARGEQCDIRTPVCSFEPEQTVLCHYRLIGISGAGLKAPDLLGAHGCAPCHTLVDTGRYGDVELTQDDCDLYLLRGMARTQAKLIKRGHVRW